jgi:GntR family transcriptional regulator
MMFELDFRSRVPIYEQLVEKFKEMVINHILKPDEQLPPVRTLAGELTINPNTIQKAYRELEHRGYIYSIPGKGHFVLPAAPPDRSPRLDKLKQELLGIVSEMRYLGLNQEDIVSMVATSISDHEGGSENHD